MTSMSKRKLVLAVPVLALVLASCGGDRDLASPGEMPRGAPEDDPRPTLAVADSTFGAILVDAEGNTLYAFTQDRDGVSACYDDCAVNWPALISEGELRAGEGVERSLLGTAVRADGSEQVSYAGRPLYHFAGDRRPADTNGQGLGDVWFVVSPVGEILQDSSPGNGYGYGAGS